MSKLQGPKLLCHLKGLFTSNTNLQYFSGICFALKVMTNVQVFEKLVKLQGQGHKVKNYGTVWKVLSRVIHMCNKKEQQYTCAVRKLYLLLWKL